MTSQLARRLQKTPSQIGSDVRSDGLIVTIAATNSSCEPAIVVVQRVVGCELGGEWIIKSLGKDCRDYSARRPPDKENPTVAEAFDMARKLRQHHDIEDCEVSLVLPTEAPAWLRSSQSVAVEGLSSDAMPHTSSSLAGPDSGGLPCSGQHDWALVDCSIRDAWQLTLPGNGKAKGEGILVGHPDTGYTIHPQLDASRLLATQGYDFEDDDVDPIDPIEGEFGGHGTSTGSIIMSGELDDGVAGVAPKCNLIPLRVTSSVILFSFSRLVPAIRFAADHGHHVLSISLGGPFPSSALERAVQYAISKGVIICCAAGNEWPFVVYPARLDQVVACAASNCQRKPWDGSASGPKVDITAPGESVWRAFANKDGQNIFGRNHGTSFSTAITAGCAALWLAFHGRDNLIARYGISKLSMVFATVLKANGFDRPGAWDSDSFGPGILNAKKLLLAPLPTLAELDTASFLGAAIATSAPPNKFERLIEFLPSVDPLELRTKVKLMLRANEEQLNAKFQEVGDEIVYHALMDLPFRNSMMEPMNGSALESFPISNSGHSVENQDAEHRPKDLTEGWSLILPRTMSHHLTQMTSASA